MKIIFSILLCAVRTYSDFTGSSLRSSLKGRISNGDPIERKTFPHVVDITTLKEYISTGVVIAPHSILTAADKMHVYEQMGNYGELLVNDGQMRHSILMVKTRDGYKKDSVGSYYDIAIVTLCTATEVKEAILPEDKFTLGESTKVKLVGFNHMVPTSPYMIAMFLKLRSMNECAETLKRCFLLQDELFCADSSKHTKTVERNDVGSPIFAGKNVLVGILSGGFFGQPMIKFMVFTSLSDHLKFIENTKNISELAAEEFRKNING